MFIQTVFLNIAKELNPLSENVYTDLSNSIFQIFKMFMNVKHTAVFVLRLCFWYITLLRYIKLN